eukprot:COSAG06_NODE_2925_length_6082_cov_7.451613_8_plen_172_part_00
MTRACTRSGRMAWVCGPGSVPLLYCRYAVEICQLHEPCAAAPTLVLPPTSATAISSRGHGTAMISSIGEGQSITIGSTTGHRELFCASSADGRRARVARGGRPPKESPTERTGCFVAAAAMLDPISFLTPQKVTLAILARLSVQHDDADDSEIERQAWAYVHAIDVSLRPD